jgi:WD40 repeat protein
VCSLLLGALAGCGGSGTTAPPPPTIGQIYVAKGTGAFIARFKAGDNGDAAPQAGLGTARTNSLCFDVQHNRLAGTSADGPAILVLIDNPSTSSVSRSISGANTTMNFPGGCALDGTADVLYAVDANALVGATAIFAFGPASTASGNIAPLHTIAVSYAVGGIAVDPANNRLFVADSTNNVINIYDAASTLNGAANPSRTIGGPLTQLAQVGPLAFDPSDRLLVGSSFINSGTAVRVFSNAGSINGNVAPSASFALANSTMDQIAVTPAGDLYVVNSAPEILVFANVFTASGTINPVRIITGPNTQLDTPIRGIPPLVIGIAVDPTR